MTKRPRDVRRRGPERIIEHVQPDTPNPGVDTLTLACGHSTVIPHKQKHGEKTRCTACLNGNTHAELPLEVATVQPEQDVDIRALVAAGLEEMVFRIDGKRVRLSVEAE